LKNVCRPKVALQRIPLENLLDFGVVASLVYVWGLLFIEWNVLPDKIPTHFGALGNPDGWGSKSTLFMLPCISTALSILLSVVSYFPNLANFPWPITEANAVAQYRNIRSMLAWLKLEIVWIFVYLEWGTIQVAQRNKEGLNPTFLFLTLAIIAITIAMHLIKGYKSR
jgi:uncharacterized membrane protein